jgi:uracil-DNA glycosylase family 4
VKRRAYRDWKYWGRPVPGFGDRHAQLLIIGLAPAAHGANRTGRMFTGDRSGDFLYEALYRSGFASQPTSVDRNDGLVLNNVYITASARCAPPDNRPMLDELHNCRGWLERELALLPNVQAVIALGRIAFDSYLALLREQGKVARRSGFSFGHNRMHHTGPGQPVLLSSYHPSQQNTNTGKLTMPMLLDVFELAKRVLSISCNVSTFTNVSYF